MECTATPPALWWGLLVFHGDWEVAIWKWADDGSSTTTSATAAVFTNQLFCQLKAEALDVGEGTRGTVVLHKEKGVSYSYIEQEGEDVLIKFPALCPAAIITPKLISSIHSPHELVVADDALWTGDRNSRTILQPSKDSPHSSWLTVR